MANKVAHGGQSGVTITIYGNNASSIDIYSTETVGKEQNEDSCRRQRGGSCKIGLYCIRIIRPYAMVSIIMRVSPLWCFACPSEVVSS